MAELEPGVGDSGLSQQPQPPEASGVQIPPEELQDTPEGWAQRLGSLDFYKDHRTAIAVVGAAALAAGVGIHLLRRHGSGDGSIFVGFADRRARDHGVISIGKVADYGAAIAVPVGEEGLKYVDAAVKAGSNPLFAMTGEPGEVVYRTTTGTKESDKYIGVAKQAAGWLMGHFSSQANKVE